MDAKQQYPQFLLFGDSIIERSIQLSDDFSFVAGLQERCSRRLDIINRGLSGYNTANAVKILHHAIPARSCAKVDYLLILFGANDACVPTSPTRQHVPLEKYRDNIKTILSHPLVRSHSPKILLVTPPPINEVHLEAEDFKKGYSAVTRHQEVTAKYADAIREIAADFKEQDVILIDLWTAVMKEAIALTPGQVPGGSLLGSKETGDSDAMRALLSDGLHLTGPGYKVFLDEVLPMVGKAWSEEPVDNPAWIFPHWTVAPKVD